MVAWACQQPRVWRRWVIQFRPSPRVSFAGVRPAIAGCSCAPDSWHRVHRRLLHNLSQHRARSCTCTSRTVRRSPVQSQTRIVQIAAVSELIHENIVFHPPTYWRKRDGKAFTLWALRVRVRTLKCVRECTRACDVWAYVRACVEAFACPCACAACVCPRGTARARRVATRCMLQQVSEIFVDFEYTRQFVDTLGENAVDTHCDARAIIRL